MKSSIVAIAAVMTTAIGVAGLTDGGFLRQDDKKFNSLSAANQEASVAVGSVADKGGRSSAAHFTEVAQAEKPSEEGASQAKPEPVVDESALRYFAAKGDTARLQAEISRLRSLYPDWVPPADPLAVPRNTDVALETMWRLYSEGRYAEVRKAIAERQAKEAAWQPPSDLLERLNVAEARARLVNASELKQYETVISIAASTPSLLTCSEVDVLWHVANAFAQTKRPERARDAYLYVLKSCENAPERLATVQKAAAVLPYATLQDLLALERTTPEGVPEFESIRDDLARRFVAEGDEDKALAVDPRYVQRVETLAETGGAASDALLLGWYQLRRDNMSAAEQWFRRAHDKEDSASASQGLALTLIARNAPAEAEAVLYPWRASSPDALATYFAATANLLAIDPPVALDAAVLARIAQETTKGRDAATAQQFGWYARALNQPATAALWFATALRWKPDDEPSAYGLALSRDQLGDKDGVVEIQRLWSGRSERIARLGEVKDKLEEVNRTQVPTAEAQAYTPPQSSTRATAVAEVVEQPVTRRPRTGGTAQKAVRSGAGCRTTINPAGLAPQAALARGWCLMDLNRPLEAAEAFEVALQAAASQIREDAAYGQSLAYLRAGLTNKAAVSATKSTQTRGRVDELQTAILADRAIAAFDAKRYREAILFLDQLGQISTRRQDLMVLRGYSYMNLKYYAEARRIFEALAATGNRDAMQGLAAVEASQEIWPNKN
ncbi:MULTISPECIES: cellulose synthase [unclassified Ensifer]|uniref:cellulose synthase n=1 Tax=unclassified Ensifer TaxID=2633371 RepID=UPI000812D533|nr:MULTISPECIES: cellulose synthase [unclassified Ensifer]OCP04273.1 cellulose synthase [Ensifer sp. LC11]OCP04532.1 cellulose synthase [Ensifer sp. LC13]OCP08940.1 cellulose synthase [Ensifer sp. LC14]OCP30445.1 cellulose synthase [Ensifer sp. LC499]